MDLRSGSPYWLFHTPLLHTRQLPDKDITTDVVVVGTGISGALVAYELVKAGYNVCMVSKRHVGTGSTVASTALLQYEIDTPLNRLIEITGNETAVRSYRLCAQSILKLENIHRQLGIARVFERRKSLLLASAKKHVKQLEAELIARQQSGLQVQWLTAMQLEKDFGLNAAAAIYSTLGAQTNSYLLTQKLVQWCINKGVPVYNQVKVTGVKQGKGRVTALTGQGITLTGKYLVMATGYEALEWLDKKIATLHSTYAIISEPFREQELWKDKCLIWETARPYIYLRTTPDNRVIIGGKDEPFFNPRKRDQLLRVKSRQLQHAFHKMFPRLNFKIEHAWAGTFAQTPDGLPYIGATPQWPRVLFALGYGGNGITFSEVAAHIIRDIIAGTHNPDIKRYRFNRV